LSILLNLGGVIIFFIIYTDTIYTCLWWCLVGEFYFIVKYYLIILFATKI